MRALDAIALGGTRLGDEVAVDFSAHALERYGERVRTALEPEQVRCELSRMLSSAVVTATAPDWVRDRGAFAYLVLGDVVCLPLHLHRNGELMAATALWKDAINAETRERRNSARRRRQSSRASARKKDGGRRPDAPDDWRADA